MAYGDEKRKKPSKMVGRERDDNDSRLNSFQKVTLGNRSNQEEISWVLFDKNDESHAKIPLHIQNQSDLPHGTLVISVDLTALSAAEANEYRRQIEEGGEKFEIPPQSHAVYITGREGQLNALRGALTRTIDERGHGSDPKDSTTMNYGVAVLSDRPTQEEACDNYHMIISGNNHPESPVDGLRRITTGGSLFKLIERLSVEGPSGHEFKNRLLLNEKPNLVSPHLAKELFFEIANAVRTRSGRHEEGLFERLQWPEGDANTIQGKLDRLAATDKEILARAEENRDRQGLGKSTARLADEAQSGSSGPSRSGNR